MIPEPEQLAALRRLCDLFRSTLYELSQDDHLEPLSRQTFVELIAELDRLRQRIS